MAMDDGVRFEHCRIIGPPPPPFSRWEDWAASGEPYRGVTIFATVTLDEADKRRWRRRVGNWPIWGKWICRLIWLGLLLEAAWRHDRIGVAMLALTMIAYEVMAIRDAVEGKAK